MSKRVKYIVRVGEYGGDMAGFLDMLRYDGATVESWNRSGTAYEVTLSTEVQRFTPDRWRSFGISTVVVS